LPEIVDEKLPVPVFRNTILLRRQSVWDRPTDRIYLEIGGSIDQIPLVAVYKELIAGRFRQWSRQS